MKKVLCLLLVAVLLCSGCGRLVYISPTPMVHITYSAAEEEPLTDAELKQCATILEQRLTAIAISDFKISPDRERGTLEVDVPRRHYPGNLNKLAENWGSKGELAICIDENGGDPPIPPEGVVLHHGHVVSAEAVSLDGDFAVQLIFTADGAEILSNTTKRLTATCGALPIWMDWQLVSTAQVMQPITEGEALVNGFATWEAASLFAAKINGEVMPRSLGVAVDFSDAE